MLDPRRYKPADFDDHGNLRVHWLMVVVMLFGCRHFLVLLLGGFSTYMGSRGGSPEAEYASLYSAPVYLLASVPALAVLVSTMRRSAMADRWIRWTWGQGRWLLLLGVALDLSLLIGDWSLGRLEPTSVHIAVAIIDVYIGLYLLCSSRARDTFGALPDER